MADTPSRLQERCAFGAREMEVGQQRNLSVLMQRLRSKHVKSWPDASKNLRAVYVDKHPQNEILEKTQLQKHLEALQKAFKVTNLSAMSERLESLSKQLGLKYSNSSPTDIFVSNEAFHVQIKLENSGSVASVKVVHSNAEAVNCEIIRKLLSTGDFCEFEKHLKGLATLYHINGDKKQRNKSFLALHALEEDLNKLARVQKGVASSVSDHVHKTPIGIVEPREGGKAMRLVYFVSPYDMLDPSTGKVEEMTIKAITEKELGHSVTVGIESCARTHKLQTMSLLTVNKYDGTGMPSFANCTNQNSSLLPAVFVLKLAHPQPLSVSVIRKIQATTGQEFVDMSQSQSLVSLLLQRATKNKVKEYSPDTGLHVTLPDQQHNYFLNTVSESEDLSGIIVSKIPFTHPTHVGQIILHLRHQVAFNCFVSSFMRPNPIQDSENAITFEVTPLSLQCISLTFENPHKESMATVEFDLTDVTNIKSNIASLGEAEESWNEEFVNKIVQRCLSVPVTMRAMLRSAAENMDPNSPSLPTLPTTFCRSKKGENRRQSFLEAHGYRFGSNAHGSREQPILTLQTMKSLDLVPDAYESLDYMDTIGVEESGKGNVDKVQRNPMLASLLDHDSNRAGGTQRPPPMATAIPSPLTQTQPSVLSALLGDQSPQNGGMKKKGPRKRKSTSDRSPIGKSPKRKIGDEEFVQPGFSSFDMDSGFEHPLSNSFAHNNNAGLTTPPIGMMEESPSYPHHPSPMSRLTSMEGLIKNETKPTIDLSKHSELVSILGDSGKSKDDGMLVQVLNSKSEEHKQHSRTPSMESLLGNSAAKSAAIYNLETSPFTNNSHKLQKRASLDGDLSTIRFDALAGENENASNNSTGVNLNWNSVCHKNEGSFDKVEEKKVKKEENSTGERISLKLNLNRKGFIKVPDMLPDGSNEVSVKKELNRSSSFNERPVSEISEETSDLSKSMSQLEQSSLSSGLSEIKKFKSDTSLGSSKEEKKKKIKYDGDRKRKLDKSEREKSKKKKIYDFPDDDRHDYKVVKPTSKPTKIKITMGKPPGNSTVKPVLSHHSSKSSSKHSSNKAASIKSHSSSKDRSLSLSHSKASSLQRPSQNKFKSKMNRSKSESSQKMDSKLSKTPTIKLKPLNITSSSATYTVNTSAKNSQMPQSAPILSKSSSASNPLSSTMSGKPASKSQPPAPKPKKEGGGLQAVIDKLKKKSSNPSSSVSQKDQLEEIRKQIIQAGNKPSTPTKEISSMKSFKKAPPSSLGPIPKLNNRTSLSSPKTSSGPSTPSRTTPTFSKPANRESTPKPAMKASTPTQPENNNRPDPSTTPENNRQTSKTPVNRNPVPPPSKDLLNNKYDDRHFLDVMQKLGEGKEGEGEGGEKEISPIASPDGSADIPTIASPESHGNPEPTQETNSQAPVIIPVHKQNKADSHRAHTPKPAHSPSPKYNHSKPANRPSTPANEKVNSSHVTPPASGSSAPKGGESSRTEKGASVSTENKENTVVTKDDAVFKAPTPKPWVRNSEENTTKMVLSPRSDVSSPDADGLVIDVNPLTPKSVLSPIRRDRSPSAPKSPIPASPRKPLPCAKVSPASSPHPKSPMMPRNSPASHDIEDDLMDAALSGSGLDKT